MNALSAVIGLFSHDLAVDLGTATVRLYLSTNGGLWSRSAARASARPRAGALCIAPTAVAIHTDRAGHRRVTAIGSDVVPMIGRTPPDVSVVRPFRRGLVADRDVGEKMLLHLVRLVHGRNGWMRPRVWVAVPYQAPDDEIAVVRATCEAIGCREVRFVPRPLAAALGAQLPVNEPAGVLIVDVGASCTEVSVLSLSGIVSSRAVAGGGRGFDQAIGEWLEQERDLLVGDETAAQLKHAIGAAHAPSDAVVLVKGRCLLRGVPRAEPVSGHDLRVVLGPGVDAISEAIRGALAEAPPELAADIVETGVTLTGGGAVLQGLDQALRDRTGLPVARSATPDRAVIHGTGRVLDEPGLLPALTP